MDLCNHYLELAGTSLISCLVSAHTVITVNLTEEILYTTPFTWLYWCSWNEIQQNIPSPIIVNIPPEHPVFRYVAWTPDIMTEWRYLALQSCYHQVCYNNAVESLKGFVNSITNFDPLIVVSMLNVSRLASNIMPGRSPKLRLSMSSDDQFSMS